MSRGGMVSLSAALVVLVCFFLPWITVSCSSQEIASLSGYELTTGTEIDLGVGTEEVEADLLYLTIPLSALVVAGLAFGAALGWMPRSPAATGQMAVATLSLAVLAYKWLEARADASDVGFVSFSTEIGLWGVVVGLVVIIISAFLSRFGRERPPP